MIALKLTIALATAVTPRMIYIPPRPEPTPIIIVEDGALDNALKDLPPMMPAFQETLHDIAMFRSQL